MQIELAGLAIGIAPVVAWIIWRARRLEGVARGSIRIAAIVLLLAIAGISVQCDRDLRVQVWVDLSASTRTATFRDARSVQARLEQLMPGRAVTIRYFADGEVQVPLVESSATHTRLPAISGVDAMVLMSDGRFDLPQSALPAVYTVVDPALDATPDGQIEDLSIDAGVARLRTKTSTSDRVVRLDPINRTLAVARGPLTRVIEGIGSSLTATLNDADAWPENDVMSAIAAPALTADPVWIGDPSDFPTDAVMLSSPAIVLDTRVRLSDAQATRLTQYARDMGGVLILAGSPAAPVEPLRRVAPLSATPPQPQADWLILLDASGSMAQQAGDRSRWDRAVLASIAAISKLDEPDRVSIVTFAKESERIADRVSPTDAIAKLQSIRRALPSGPTGLEMALLSIAKRSSSNPVRLLLVSDADATIADPDTLAKTLSDSAIRLFVLATMDLPNAAPLKNIAEKSGGTAVSESDPSRWSDAIESLLSGARGDDLTHRVSPVTTHGAIASVPIVQADVHEAFIRSESQILATAPDGKPVIAIWRVGLGYVASIAARIDPATLASIANLIKQSPTDPRITADWRVGDESVVVTAANQTPLNGLQFSLVRDGVVSALKQVAPGRYTADLPRSTAPSVGVIALDSRVVSRQAIPSRYPREFDEIGNDLASLESLAKRTGGRLIEAGDTAPIDFARATELKSLRPLLSAIGLGLIVIAIVFIRAPYLADRLRAYARRSVR